MTNNTNTDKNSGDTTYVNAKTPKRWGTGGVIWGVLIIAVGILLLLDNIGVYSFSIAEVWRLWPLLIIGLGLSMLPLKGWLSAVAAGVFVVTALGALLYVTAIEPDPSVNTSKQSIQVDAPGSAVEVSDIRVKVGASAVQVGSSNSVDLVDATLESSGFSLHQSDRVDGNSHVVDIRTEGGPSTWPLSLGNFRNDLTLNLAEDHEIDLTIDAGATKIEGDLSKVLLRHLVIDTGASSTDLKLGANLPLLEVSLDTGASSVTLRIPHSAGVRVTVDDGLSKRDFEGITEVSEDVYESSNYEDSEHKIVISADTGASSFKVVRY